MNFRVIQGEIDKLRQEDTDLAQRHTETTAALKTELAKDAAWFDERVVAEHRHKLAEIEQRRGLVVDRAAALEGRLPTREQRRDAKRQAQTLLKGANEACQRSAHEWQVFMHALVTAHVCGAELTAARTDARSATVQLADLVAEHGLDVAVPKVPEPPADETTYAGLLGTQLRDVGYTGEADPTTERDLAAAAKLVAT